MPSNIFYHRLLRPIVHIDQRSAIGYRTIIKPEMSSQLPFVHLILLTVLISSYSVRAFTITTSLSAVTTHILLQPTGISHGDVLTRRPHCYHTPLLSSSKLELASTAGNFDWGTESDTNDDNNEQQDFDQGVDNPFKRPDLMDDYGTLKIDPARLLSPRMNGSNIYLVGMMGSGKSAVGKIIAKRTCIA
jgi:hypothetical protein